MSIPNLPEDFIQFLFNFDQGRHLDTYCSTCRKVTDQVVVSYRELPLSRQRELDRVLGGILDMIPGIPRFAFGKPTVCYCGTLNR